MKSPLILSSDGSFFWQLADFLKDDYFSFYSEGARALLLIGAHLSDPYPWRCARHPVLFDGPVGLIDAESKKILGKRFARLEHLTAHPDLGPPSNRPRSTTPKIETLRTVVIDPFAEVLRRLDQSEDMLDPQASTPWRTRKTPGKIVPRAIKAKLTVKFGDRELTLYGRNYGDISQCLHAELALLLALSRILGQNPESPQTLEFLRVTSALKPCRMCAAFLHIVRKKCAYFSVEYDLDDPGPLARHTLLDQFGYGHSG
jgi:hypothetical protein